MNGAPNFASFILDHGIVGFFSEPITLKSGAKSHFYVNWRKATNDAFLLDQLTDYIIRYLTEHGMVCDSIYGVPEGATKTAVIAMLKWARQTPNYAPGTHVVAMGRAKPKEHGAPEDRYFIGMPHGRVLVLEDTVTTGSSLFVTIDRLLALGVDVIGALVLTDRSAPHEAFADAFHKRYDGKLSLSVMSHAQDLLPPLLKDAPALLRHAVLTELGARHESLA